MRAFCATVRGAADGRRGFLPVLGAASPSSAAQEGILRYCPWRCRRAAWLPACLKHAPAACAGEKRDVSPASRVLLSLQAGKKRGVAADLLARNLESTEALLPGLVNLHKAKAGDWVRPRGFCR